MEKKAELESEWVAIGDISIFHEKLDAATDEFRFRILAALLANELKDLKDDPVL